MARSHRGIPRAVSRLLTMASFLLTAGCTEYYTLDLGDENLGVPDNLAQRLAAFRSGAERWHGDPKAVADLALRNSPNYTVPWIAEPFRASQYDFKESAEWGTYVVRGYLNANGNLTRYRVKVRPYREIWYPIQISHYKMYPIDDDEMHPLDPK